DDAMDRRQAWHRSAAAFHGIPSRLEDARQTAHTGCDIDACPLDRASQWARVRLYRQRALSERLEHLLSALHRVRHRARLVRDRSMAARRPRVLCDLRRADSRRFLRPAWRLGREANERQDRRSARDGSMTLTRPARKRE